MAEFCVMFYFLTWFEIKHKSNVSDGSNYFFKHGAKSSKDFLMAKFKKIAIKFLQRHVYSAHPKNQVLNMLCDEK